MPLEVSLPKFLLAIVVNRGSFDRANDRLARRQAKRPIDEIVDVLRRKARSRFTPPGAGPDARLTDLLVHGLDIRWPLKLPRRIPEGRLQKSLTFLTTPAARGIVAKNALTGLRIEPTDVDWVHGQGPTLSGDTESLLLALTGRTSALNHLHGDGAPILRSRLFSPHG